MKPNLTWHNLNSVPFFQHFGWRRNKWQNGQVKSMMIKTDNK